MLQSTLKNTDDPDSSARSSDFQRIVQCIIRWCEERHLAHLCTLIKVAVESRQYKRVQELVGPALWAWAAKEVE